MQTNPTSEIKSVWPPPREAFGIKTQGHQGTQTKESFGIILLRKREDGYQVLLVNKRTSFGFVNFVFGKYSSINDVGALLQQMTRDELVMLLSLDFERMWFQVLISAGSGAHYNKCKCKFTSTFIKPDDGQKLLNLVRKTHPTGIHLWEFPKGRKSNSREPEIVCAIRELCEETKIEKNEFKVIPELTFHDTYMMNGIIYKHTFFAATANRRLCGGSRDESLMYPKVREGEGEVCSVKWVYLRELDFYDHRKKIKRAIIPIIKQLKRIERNN